ILRDEFTTEGAAPARSAVTELQTSVYDLLGEVHPFHWQLEYPEVFGEASRHGFDAFVGNPLFMGGKRISMHLGEGYHFYLKTRWGHKRGSADLCAYFFLRGFECFCMTGFLGMLATNTISQGDTREVGFDYLVASGGQIYYVNK